MKCSYLWCLFVFFIGNVAVADNVLFAEDWPEGGASPWYLQPGFYYMLDYPVNIRSQPNLQGAVIGSLGLHDRIEILENTDIIPQKINDMWAFWYRIRHNNREGYIWGGFVAENTFIFDIDGNGQDDFFQHRITSVSIFIFKLNPATDIFIYINGRRISTANVATSEWVSGCSFEQVNNNVRMTLGAPGLSLVYEIDATGTIRFIERNEWESEL